MDGKYPLATTAALFAEPARAAVLLALLDGSARPASQLALLAKATPSAMSMHLARLLQGRLLICTRSGRNRYYRLAGPEVARALESLGALASGLRPTLLRPDTPPPALHLARTCYDHLAGRLGVQLCDALQAKDFLRLVGDQFVVTAAGARFFQRTGWAPGAGVAAKAARRPAARACLDWTERRPHLGGALGASLLAWLLQHGWITQQSEPRVVRVTAAGRRGFKDLLGLDSADWQPAEKIATG